MNIADAINEMKRNGWAAIQRDCWTSIKVMVFPSSNEGYIWLLNPASKKIYPLWQPSTEDLSAYDWHPVAMTKACLLDAIDKEILKIGSVKPIWK